jgi:hypothetical protein
VRITSSCLFSFSLACSLCLVLSGCSLSAPSAPTPAAGLAIQGTVHGGQNPIVGAQVYLFAAGSGVFTPNASGYGNASVSLLNSSGLNTAEDTTPSDATFDDYYVSSGAGGTFSISGDYTCTGGQQVYLYAVGGNTGSGPNSAAGLLAALGTCPGTAGSLGNTFASGLFVTMNEVSTVAAAYALAGFATDAVHVSSSGTALAQTGLANAFLNAGNMEALLTGVALTTTPAGNGTVPQATLYTLANILASCVNSTGSTSTACTTLLNDAKSGGSAGAVPTDTATAAINIAHNPGANIMALYALGLPSPPFSPALTVQPNDFTIAISYSGGGLNSPVPIAIDGTGNVWVGNTATGANTVSEFSPVGGPVTGSPFSGGGIVDPYSIAIDKSGNVWTANVTPDSLSELHSNGMPISTSAGYTLGGLNAPYDIAFDQLGNVWVVNNVGTSLSEFSSTGSPLTTSTGDTGGGLFNPISLAIDAAGDIWVTNSITLGSLSEFHSAGVSPGSPISTSNGDTGGGLNDPWGLAIDGSGNVWAVNSGTGANSISLFGASGSPTTTSTGYTGGGLNVPEGIAIDGAGNVWVANRGGTGTSPPYPPSTISEFNSSGTAISPSTGYQAGLSLSLCIAVDGSGNVWVPNAALNTVTEFVGGGAPVVTPMVANLLSPYGLHAVNRP